MSCWRVLRLCEQPDDNPIPQLLVKSAFHQDSYVVHLTDLSNIWSEELGLDEVVDRASQEQSPIEVSKQDTAQLAILLENVAKPLDNAAGATCRMTRQGEDRIILHASISLPEPLGHLAWKFHMRKRTSALLKNELILPLLVSSHIQHERITSLVRIITSKDKAITRLLDQFESTNLDLATAFPSAGGIKAGRRVVKREQAAKHVPALQPFHESAWRQDTAQLKDLELTSLGLFQEALAESTSKVPEQLKSENFEAWWTSVPTCLTEPKAPVKRAAKKSTVSLNPENVSESSEEETEDEFDTHENFKTRDSTAKSANTTTALSQKLPLHGYERDESDSTEEESDLDAPLHRHSQSQVSHASRPIRRKSTSPQAAVSPVTKTNPGGFHIGGRPERTSLSPPPLSGDADPGPKPDDILTTRESVPPSSKQVDIVTTPKKSRKSFRIGGKGKVTENDSSQRTTTLPPSRDRMRSTKSPTAGPPSSPPAREATREMTPVEEVVEETPEEKAERRRAELKRKNEEAAKKQGQQKRKKRF